MQQHTHVFFLYFNRAICKASLRGAVSIAPTIQIVLDNFCAFTMAELQTGKKVRHVNQVKIIAAALMPKVSRARHQQRHAAILAQRFGIAIALAAARVHQTFHAGINQ